MAASSPIAKQRRAITKLWLAWRLPLLVAVVVAAVAAGAWYGWSAYTAASAAAAEKERERLAEETGQRFTSVVAGAIAAVKQAVNLERAASALASADENAIAAFEQDVAAVREDVLGVRLVPADASDVDYQGMPPLSYAALDLVRRTREAGVEQPAEVHLFGQDAAHIALLLPVPGEADAPVGFVLVALDTALIRAAVTASGVDPSGRLEVQQSVPGAPPLSLVEVGTEAVQGEPSLATRVRGTAWRLRYWAPGAGVTPTESDPLLPLPMAGAAGAAVLALALAVVALRRRRAPRSTAAAGARRAVETVEDALSSKLAALSSAVDGDAPRPVEPDEGDGDEAPAPATTPAADEDGASTPPAGIFRAYDIRGVVGDTLTPEMVRAIGRAIGSEAYERSQQTVVVGYDGRESSPTLADALTEGLRASGRDVIDIGRVPTPVLYFATHHLETGSGVMITGSHNPREYNGLKIMLAGDTLYGEAITSLRERIVESRLASGEGTLQQMDVVGDYIRRVTEDIPVALGSAYRVVVDCGNGVAGEVVPKLLRGLGHDVTELYCEVDGSFPNHHPDPSDPKNLADLVRAVKKEGADIGFAFDGDGDRLVVIDGEGRVLWPDRQMMLFARDVLAKNAGATIVYDIKCTSRLGRVIAKLGGKPLMWKTGHSLVKAKMKETKALLAGEMSGHVFFADRWYGFDDALYSAARLLEILMGIGAPPAQVFAKLPTGMATPELRIELDEGEPARFMEQLLQGDRFPGAETTTIDGLRADYQDGWGLVRASNTTPCLVLRFEADSKDALQRIQGEFRQALLEIDAGLALPF